MCAVCAGIVNDEGTNLMKRLVHRNAGLDFAELREERGLVRGRIAYKPRILVNVYHHQCGR